VPKPQLTQNAQVPYLTSSFKIWLVAFIFFLTFLHVFNIVFLPQESIIPEKMMLGIVLGLMAFLWLEEVRDRHRLQIVINDLSLIERDQKGSETDAISALLLVQETVSPESHRHAQRVLSMGQAMGEALEFSWEQMKVLRRACILHDLGKLSLPGGIRNKRYIQMTDEEKALFRKHPRKTVELLTPLRFLVREKVIILHHHERMDGQGYPSGLKGEQIPLESRMIAIANAFDALNRIRLERQEGCTEDFVLEELRRFGGSRLDARLVVKFLEVLRKNPEFWKIED